MNTIRKITSHFAVAGALAPADFGQAAADGFKTVINFRPDHEAPGQMTAAEGRTLASAHGLGYVHIPSAKYDVFTGPVVEAARAALAASNGPVLAYCASGQRALMIWAAAEVRHTPVERVLQSLKAAGFDLQFLRDDLDAQADRAHWMKNEPVATATEACRDEMAEA